MNPKAFFQTDPHPTAEYLPDCPDLLDICPYCFQRALFVPDFVRALDNEPVKPCLNCDGIFTKETVIFTDVERD
jgi:hypothetical protein